MVRTSSWGSPPASRKEHHPFSGTGWRPKIVLDGLEDHAMSQERKQSRYRSAACAASSTRSTVPT